MTKNATFPYMHQVYWATASEWGRSQTEAMTTEAGITHPAGSGTDADPDHPFKSTLNERWIEFDGNSTAHEIQMQFGYLQGNNLPTGYRTAMLTSFAFRTNSTAPSSDAMISETNYSASGVASNLYRIYLTTTLALKLTYEATSEAEATVATSTSTLSANTNYVIELWHVIKDAAGTNLTTQQHVLRVLLGFSAGNPPTMATYINVAQGTRVPLSTSITYKFGEDTQRGAGFKFWIALPAHMWQDADDPYGVLRADRMDIDGVSAGTNMDQWGGTATDVDESGGAIPDDATTEDQGAHTAASQTKTQMYTLGAPSYATSSDSIVGICMAQRLICPTGAKGVTNTLKPVLGDGTNLAASVHFLTNNSTAYDSQNCGSHFDAAGGALAHGDLAGMEVGCQSFSDAGVSFPTFKASAFFTLVIYQAAGETTGAVDAYPSTDTRSVHSGTLVGLGAGVF